MSVQALHELRAQAVVHARTGDRYWRSVLTFADACLTGQPLVGRLTPHELREISVRLSSPVLREIAAQAAPQAAGTLAFHPLLPEARPQRWRVNDVAFTPGQRGAQGAYHAMYVALTVPGEPFDIAPFLKPHSLRFDGAGLRTQAVAMYQNIERARRQIRAAAPALARALQFECGRAGTLRYVGGARIYAPTPDKLVV